MRGAVDNRKDWRASQEYGYGSDLHDHHLTLIVPVNLKDRDEFHLTIEEYLQALISLLEELVCLSNQTLFPAYTLRLVSPATP